MNHNENDTHTSFGFQKILKGEKGQRVKDVFTSVANKYDLMNDMMSGGLHRLWKRNFVKKIHKLPHSSWIDVAGGTGDIPLYYHKLYGLEPSTTCKIIDPNNAMLEEGRNRLIDQGCVQGIEHLCASAESLPLPDESVDLYTISFGIRNVTDLKTAFQEAYRVLKKGGHFLCLEFTPPQNKLLEPLYHFYLMKIIPKLGELIAKDRPSYQYLSESILGFLTPQEFTLALKDQHFEKITYDIWSGGIVAFYHCQKL
jgi:demethylmenaquinone methyltransferase / 2-methoxy-6-polyprenyl-1,4-benzoquinol methylase